jgi:hypothetical protein
VRSFTHILISSLLLLLGCNIQELDFDNLKLKEIESDLAIPIGNAKYTMREFIDDGELLGLDFQETADGLLYLIYQDQSSYTYGDELVNIPDIDNNSSLGLPLTGVVGGPTSVPFNISFTQPYQPADNEELTSVTFGAGTIEVDITTTLTSNISYDLTMSSISGTFPFNGTMVGGAPVGHSSSLAGRTMTFTRQAGQNVYSCNITGSISLTAGQQITASDNLVVSISLSGQTFTIIYGKFGQDILPFVNQPFALDFPDFEALGIKYNAEVAFTFQNELGVPFGIDFSQMYGTNGTEQVNLSGSVIVNRPVIAAATTPGTAVETRVVINSVNSNIENITAITPTSLQFAASGRANPSNPNAINFITPNATVNADIDVYIPLEVSMTNVSRSVVFDVGNIFNFDETDSVVLRLVIENGLPLSAILDMYFITDSQDTLFRALNNEVLTTPFLDQNLIVREPAKRLIDIPLSSAGVDALQNTDQISLRFRMSTPQSVTSQPLFVKLLTRYELSISLGARAFIKLKP